MHYHVLGLNDSSTEDDMKKPIVPWIFISTCQNQHSQVSDAMKMINEAKEKMENTLRHNDTIREEECVCIDAIREQ